MLTHNKELSTIITASPLISGVMANGINNIITTQLALSLSTSGFSGMALPVVVSSDEKTQGIITAPGKNRVELYIASSRDRLSHQSGFPIYGRISEALGVYTLSYYYLLAGVETPYTVIGPTAILFEAPYRAHIALMPTDYVAHRRVEAIQSVAQDPIRIQYIYGTANNKFTTTDGSGKLITSFDFRGQSIPFISGAGIIATNVGDALDELKLNPFPAVVGQDMTLANTFVIKAQNGLARFYPRYLADSNALMTSTTDKSQAWVHVRPSASEIGFGAASSLLLDASTAYINSSKITLGQDSQYVSYHTALLWSSMNVVMASSIISAKNITINAGIYNSVALAGDTYIVKTANAGYIQKLILPDAVSGFETLIASAPLLADVTLTIPNVSSKLVYAAVSPVGGTFTFFTADVRANVASSIMQQALFATPTLGINTAAVAGTMLSLSNYNIAGDVIGLKINAIGNLVNNSTALILNVQNGLVSNTALNIQNGDIIHTTGRVVYGGAIDATVRFKLISSTLAFAQYTSLTTPGIALATSHYIEVTGASTSNVALHLNAINGLSSNYALIVEAGQSIYGALAAVSTGSLVEYSSNSQAILLTRLTTVQMNAVTVPTDGMILYNSTANSFYGRKSGAWVDLVGGAGVTLAVTNTPTIDLTLSPGPAYSLSADVNLKDSLIFGKGLTTNGTNYLPKVTNDNIFALYPSNVLQNYDSKSGTGTFAGAADFDLATGTWTCSVSGHYLLNAAIGYRLSTADFGKQSNNPNTVGQYWVSGATDVGSFTMGFTINGATSLIGFSTKVMTQKIGSLYAQVETNLYYFNAGDTVRLSINNYTDLDMYGQSNSSILWRVLKIGK